MTLKLKHYKPRQAKKIGEGYWTLAYQKGRIVYLVTSDPIKECLAMFCQRQKHVPRLRRLFQLPNGKWVFMAPYYPSPPYRSREAKYISYLNDIRRVEGNLAETYLNAIKEADLPQPIKNALTTIIESAMNCGSSRLKVEFPSHNLRTDSRGNLVFLDIVFSSEYF